MNWLKSLFRKKEEEVEETTVILEPASLEAWFIKEKEARTADISKALTSTRNELENGLDRMEGLLEILEDTLLYEPCVTLFSQVRHGCSNIDDMLDLQEVLESFVADHSRHRQTLSGEQARSAAELFSLIESLYARLQQTAQEYDAQKETLEFLRSIHIDIKEFTRKVVKKKELETQLLQIDQKHDSAQALKERIDRDLSTAQQTTAYQEYLKLVEEKEDAQKQFNQIQKRITAAFSPLTSLLREYAKIALERPAFVESYALDPADALLRDEGLALRNLLSSMRAAIQSGSLAADNAVEETISRIFEQADSLQFELKNVQAQKVRALKRFGATHYEIEDLRYKQEHALKQFEKVFEERETLKNQLGELSVDFYRKKLEQNIGAALGVEVSIV